MRQNDHTSALNPIISLEKTFFDLFFLFFFLFWSWVSWTKDDWKIQPNLCVNSSIVFIFLCVSFEIDSMTLSRTIVFEYENILYLRAFDHFRWTSTWIWSLYRELQNSFIMVYHNLNLWVHNWSLHD